MTDTVPSSEDPALPVITTHVNGHLVRTISQPDNGRGGSSEVKFTYGMFGTAGGATVEFVETERDAQGALITRTLTTHSGSPRFHLEETRRTGDEQNYETNVRKIDMAWGPINDTIECSAGGGMSVVEGIPTIRAGVQASENVGGAQRRDPAAYAVQQFMGANLGIQRALEANPDLTIMRSRSSLLVREANAAEILSAPAHYEACPVSDPHKAITSR